MTKTHNARKQAVKAQVAEALNNAPKLHGEIVSWASHGPHPYAKVKQTLTESETDTVAAIAG